MPYLHANDIDIRYEVEGDGAQTVVLINGLADELETWAGQVPALVDNGFKVVTIDNRGIGQTSKPAGPYSAEMLADDIKAVVDHLGLGRYHLMGVSMGGMIAQTYALKYGADLSSVTLACTYAAPGPFCSRMFAMWADTATVMGVPQVMRDVTLWAFTLDFFRDRGEELAEFESAMRYMNQPVPAYLAQLAVIQDFDESARLGDLASIPTLVLAGEQDILIPTRLSKELSDLIPGSVFRTTKGGHGCCWEYPDEFNAAFIGFLLQSGAR
ncbi:MAG: alpha/beta hydrolase [Bifidobacteriaceae bacterium]|jgi:3-oxoadipate enol-lactonase|nr:alpha/beta hydrolase [Bifidobacteriaceae bacterium]